MVLFLSYLYPNVINIIVLLLKLHPIGLPEIYELDYKHAIVTALLISFDACYAPSAPAGSVFIRDVLVDCACARDAKAFRCLESYVGDAAA